MTKQTPELILLKLLLAFKSYSKYYKYIKLNKEAKELKILYHTLEILQDKYPESDKTPDDLLAMVLASYPQLRDVERDAISSLVDELRSIEVSEDVALDLIRSIKARTLTRDIAIAALNASEGQAEDAEHLSELFAELHSDDEHVKLYKESNFVTDDLFELENQVVNAPGLRWRLKCLNRSLGPLRPGDFGFVFARPESGKTTFLASEITHMASQAARPIIWFNNEEQGGKVGTRVYQAALGVTADELWANKQANLDKYREVTKRNIRIYDEASIHRREVEAVMQDLQPELVLFDQIDKIEGFKADRPDLVLGRIYQWARELAKRHQCAVIGICQSDGTGEGVKWLTMSHVAEAKTSKQAEADWILGIGRSNESGMDIVRYFNISKNKLHGDQQTDPEERHGRFEVFIRPEIARYQDIDE